MKTQHIVTRKEVKAGMIAVLLGLVMLLGTTTPAQAGMWDTDPPMLTGDPGWDKVKTLWQDHRGGKNLDEIITILEGLKDKNPDKAEAYICLAKANYLHAQYIKKDKEAYFSKAENYGYKACKMDPANHYAVRSFVETLLWSRNKQYIFSKYGEFFKTIFPLKTTDAVAEEPMPQMTQYPEWKTIWPLWVDRVNVESGKKSTEMIEKLANDHPGDFMVQSWAARACFLMGRYYTGFGEQVHNEKGVPYYKRGIVYAQKAVKLKPNDMPANYWYCMNVSCSIQYSNIMVKGSKLYDLLMPLLYCGKENSSFFYWNPIMMMSIMITQGGYVMEKGMKLASVDFDFVLTGLDIGELMYPGWFFLPYCRADIYAYQGKKKEATAILEKILASNPDWNKVIAAENWAFYRESKLLLDLIKQGKR